MDMFRDDVGKALKGVANGWKKDNGKWLFYKNGCLVKSEWVKHTDGKWYFLKADGVMAAGEWVKDSGKWYAVDSTGAMRTGLFDDKGKIYFLQKDGSMLANGRINVTLNVAADGSLHP
jgi:glucan-binding YG repeat protein